jgi:hypothetical protein
MGHPDFLGRRAALNPDLRGEFFDKLRAGFGAPGLICNPHRGGRGTKDHSCFRAGFALPSFFYELTGHDPHEPSDGCVYRLQADSKLVCDTLSATGGASMPFYAVTYAIDDGHLRFDAE